MPVTRMSARQCPTLGVLPIFLCFGFGVIVSLIIFIGGNSRPLRLFTKGGLVA